jgi:hypothetical protein
MTDLFPTQLIHFRSLYFIQLVPLPRELHHYILTARRHLTHFTYCLSPTTLQHSHSTFIHDFRWSKDLHFLLLRLLRSWGSIEICPERAPASKVTFIYCFIFTSIYSFLFHRVYSIHSTPIFVSYILATVTRMTPSVVTTTSTEGKSFFIPFLTTILLTLLLNCSLLFTIGL